MKAHCFRCKPCHRLQLRVQRMLQGREDTKKAFAGMTEQERQERFRQNHEHMGPSLQSAITEVCSRKQTDKAGESFEGVAR